ncbi:MAG: DUF1592 domain-containing protein [Deltaproteobacteria bacterium]|nr:DUF1592 domain-containing protein [Deltaproteobacteria bacterium]
MRRTHCTWLSIVLCSVGCTGAINGGAASPEDGDASDGGEGGTPSGGATQIPPAPEPRFANATLVNVDRGAPCAPQGLKPTSSRRLSHSEYVQTLQDLFPGRSLPPVSFSSDQAFFGFDNINLFLSTTTVAQYAEAAFAVAKAVTDGNLQGLVGCDPAQAACAATFVKGFGARAYRRPLLTQEVDKLVAFFDKQRSAISPRAAVELTIAAMLQSPQFLLRLETTGVGDSKPARVKSYEMATRLSYMVWGSMPDPELTAAANGQLDTDAGVRSQLERMLKKDNAEPAARSMSEFVVKWLHLDKVQNESLEKDPALFPDWSPTVAAKVVDESRRFVATVFQSNGSFVDLLTSRKASVASGVAEILGQTNTSAAWKEIELPAAERAGILTRPAFLAGVAKQSYGSPPLRGVEIMQQVLCIKPLPPPDNLDLTVREEAKPGEVLSNRDRFEEKTKQSACIGCHTQIDGFGMPFESYDAIGRFRKMDGGKPVNASGQILGADEATDGDVADALALSQRLSQSEQAKFCFAVNWNRRSSGAVEGPDQWCQLDAIYDSFETSKGALRALPFATIGTAAFTSRLAD